MKTYQIQMLNIMPFSREIYIEHEDFMEEANSSV